jgi:hypothetical protein
MSTVSELNKPFFQSIQTVSVSKLVRSPDLFEGSGKLMTISLQLSLSLPHSPDVSAMLLFSHTLSYAFCWRTPALSVLQGRPHLPRSRDHRIRQRR